MRVLVTGSRSWRDADAVRNALLECAITAIHADDTLTVTHGNASRGPDAHARHWANRRGYPVINDPHPAAWTAPCRSECRKGHRRPGYNDGADSCPAAGMYRNADMVAMHPDLCLAFIAPCTDWRCRDQPPHGSHGASHCAGLADRAGIRTVRIRQEDR